MRPAYFILYGFADRNKKTKEATKSRVKITLIVKQAEFTTDSIANEKKANTNAITVYARWERATLADTMQHRTPDAIWHSPDWHLSAFC